MTQFAIVTDLNRCVGCLNCSVACKMVNGIEPGAFWNKVLRIGPNPIKEGDQFPNVEMYYLPLGCQHCKEPECVSVCPTGASHKLEDGTVQVDKQRCIGCQFCVMACPYNVRHLNETEGVVEKCTLCEQKIAGGDLPECVRQCGGRARFFGDLDQGLETFMGPGDGKVDQMPITASSREFADSDVHFLKDVGNDPSFCFILRDRTWRV